MPQVVRTTNELIVNALYLLGELGVGEVPDAYMLITGIELINELLDKFSVDNIYIPYLTTINFNFVAGQGEYSVSDMAVGADITEDRIVNLEFANYTVDTVVYPLRIVDKAQYYDLVRINNLQTRPSIIFLNKQPLESILTVYPIPDQPYPAFIQVKSMLNKLEPFDDLTTLPPYYYGFLKYALARKFLAYYPSGNWPEQNESEYWDYYNNLKAGNETNLTINPSLILTGPDPYYWQKILAYC